MSEIKFKFPENFWKNVFENFSPKEVLDEEDEILISSSWSFKKIKAKEFKWEKWNPWEKWEKWEIWPKGEKWEKWEAFKFSDFTEEQLESLKEKWEPWKNFEYSDFTEEQLEGLRWPQGVPWRDWTWAWDMLAVNNLSDLENIVVARQNLGVLSENEIQKKIESELIKENFAKKDWWNTFNWAQNFKWGFNTKIDEITNWLNFWLDMDKNRIDSYNDTNWFQDLYLRGKNIFLESDLIFFKNNESFFKLSDTIFELNFKNKKIFQTNKERLEFDSQVTTTQTTPLWDHSFVTKWYVNNLLWMQKVFDSWDLWEANNGNYAEISLNFTISENDFNSGKYLFLYTSVSNWVATTFWNYSWSVRWWDIISQSQRVWIIDNWSKVKIYNNYSKTNRRILIYKLF